MDSTIISAELAILLGHEAHRDGVVTGDTEMAVRMQGDALYTKTMDGLLANNEMLSNEIDMLKSGNMGEMLGHVLGNYDISADYWKELPDGTLVYDGDGWLKNVNG